MSLQEDEDPKDRSGWAICADVFIGLVVGACCGFAAYFYGLEKEVLEYTPYLWLRCVAGGALLFAVLSYFWGRTVIDALSYLISSSFPFNFR